MSIKTNENGIKFYPATCCNCREEFHAAKSIMQEMGAHEHGSGTCQECGTHLNLRFIPGEERMESKPWDEFIAEQQKRVLH